MGQNASRVFFKELSKLWAGEVSPRPTTLRCKVGMGEIPNDLQESNSPAEGPGCGFIEVRRVETV